MAIAGSLDRNETLRTIARRHSCRMFLDTPIDDADLAAMLEAANAAPSAHNQQSWRFIILRDEKKRRLAELVTHHSDAFPRPSSILLRMASRSIISAPVVVAVANTGDLIRHGRQLFEVADERAVDFFRTMEIQSSAAAVENLLLAATSLGILFLIKQEVLEFLGEPQGEFMAVVPLGYPAKPTTGPKKRPLDAIVREVCD